MLRLTAGQRSAVECSDLEGHGALRAAAVRLGFGYLVVPDKPEHREALIRDLTDAANSEDAHWHVFGDRAAIGACKALTNLAAKIRRLSEVREAWEREDPARVTSVPERAHLDRILKPEER